MEIVTGSSDKQHMVLFPRRFATNVGFFQSKQGIWRATRRSR